MKKQITSTAIFCDYCMKEITYKFREIAISDYHRTLDFHIECLAKMSALELSKIIGEAEEAR